MMPLDIGRFVVASVPLSTFRSRVERLGLNYAWGLGNFIVGVILGASVVGFVTGFLQSDLFK